MKVWGKKIIKIMKSVSLAGRRKHSPSRSPYTPRIYSYADVSFFNKGLEVIVIDIRPESELPYPNTENPAYFKSYRFRMPVTQLAQLFARNLEFEPIESGNAYSYRWWCFRIRNINERLEIEGMVRSLHSIYQKA